MGGGGGGAAGAGADDSGEGEGHGLPLISRNDAARLTIDVLRRGNPKLLGATFDVAWAQRWGRSSVGKEEVVLRAARQDLVGDALHVLGDDEPRARHMRAGAGSSAAVAA